MEVTKQNKTKIERKKFFDELDHQLADKYKTDIRFIGYIRSLYLGQKLSISEIVKLLEYKTTITYRKSGNNLKRGKKNGRAWPKKFYKDLINFIYSLKQSEFDDINQKTKYD